MAGAPDDGPLDLVGSTRAFKLPDVLRELRLTGFALVADAAAVVSVALFKRRFRERS